MVIGGINAPDNFLFAKIKKFIYKSSKKKNFIKLFQGDAKMKVKIERTQADNIINDALIEAKRKELEAKYAAEAEAEAKAIKTHNAITPRWKKGKRARQKVSLR